MIFCFRPGNYHGVARTKIAFSSDRRGENSKEIYVMDYDGQNQRSLTANRSLNMTPTWSPDGDALGYISYRRGSPDLFLAFIYEGRGEALVNGPGMTFTSRLVTGRPEDRVHFDSRRQFGNLLHQHRWVGTKEADRASIDRYVSVLVTQRPGDRLHLRSFRGAADLRDGCRWSQSQAHLLRRFLQRRVYLVSLPWIQRDCILIENRTRSLRHCRL